MRQGRSGPGSPDRIRTSFPDQLFAVTKPRADAHIPCIHSSDKAYGAEDACEEWPIFRVGRWILRSSTIMIRELRLRDAAQRDQSGRQRAPGLTVGKRAQRARRCRPTPYAAPSATRCGAPTAVINVAYRPRDVTACERALARLRLERLVVSGQRYPGLFAAGPKMHSRAQP